MTSPTLQTVSDRTTLARRFASVRAASERLVAPLTPEDCVIQSMPDVSPTRWHLAHVTWFFETFLLKAHLPGYRPAQPEFEYLFNSYYNAVGEQFPRPHRGLLSRPGLDEIRAYRRAVDEHTLALLDDPDLSTPEAARIVELGLHHEQQHQELMLMDIKHVFSCNPLYPAYHDRGERGPADAVPDPGWIDHPEGLREIGHDGPGFCFDNERPRHRAFVHAFRLCSRLTTNGEYLEFIRDGGYRRPAPWLADGWTAVGRENWKAPLYWIQRDGEWYEFTLDGLRPLDPSAPVAHVSYFEADAFATWAGARLPTESEWETAAAPLEKEGNFVESGCLHPRAVQPRAGAGAPAAQMFGDLWEWTASPYTPYPGFRAPEGALGEYNGKFMCNQFVMRGGACVTPASHVRATYRNFFYPHCRWQFGGIRLARDGNPGSSRTRS